MFRLATSLLSVCIAIPAMFCQGRVIVSCHVTVSHLLIQQKEKKKNIYIYIYKVVSREIEFHACFLFSLNFAGKFTPRLLVNGPQVNSLVHNSD